MDNNTDYTSQARCTQPASAAFAALTSLEALTSWWSRAEGDPTTGGELTFWFDNPVPLKLRVDEASVDRVQWTCFDSSPASEWIGTSIIFDLEDLPGGGSLVQFRHVGLTPAVECYADCNAGWNHFIPSLRQYIDTGVGNPVGTPASDARHQQPALTDA